MTGYRDWIFSIRNKVIHIGGAGNVGRCGVALNPKIASIDRDLARSRAKASYPEQWDDDPISATFSPLKQILLLERALKIVETKRFGARRAFANVLWRRMISNRTLPVRRAGPNTSISAPTAWDENTFDNYLRGRRVKPTPQDTLQILETLIGMSENIFAEHHRQGPSIRHLLAVRWSTPSECLQAILGSLSPPSASVPGKVHAAQGKPPEPSPAPGPQYGPILGKLSEVISQPDEDEAETQRALHERLRSAAVALAASLGPSGNRYAALANAAREYSELLVAATAEIDVTGIWSVGGALASFATSYRQQNIARTLAEPLEPQIEAQLLSVVRQHGAFILGFAEGRRLVQAADEFAIDVSRLREMEFPGSTLLNELTDNRDLVADRTRELHRPVRDSVLEFGWSTSRVGYAAYAIVRNSVRAMIKYSVGEKPDLAKVGGAIGLLAAASGYSNPDFIQVVVPVLQRHATELVTFFSHSPEMRAYVEWALHVLEVDGGEEG
jgi:hypothetical protein